MSWGQEAGRGSLAAEEGKVVGGENVGPQRPSETLDLSAEMSFGLEQIISVS